MHHFFHVRSNIPVKNCHRSTISPQSCHSLSTMLVLNCNKRIFAKDVVDVSLFVPESSSLSRSDASSSQCLPGSMSYHVRAETCVSSKCNVSQRQFHNLPDRPGRTWAHSSSYIPTSPSSDFYPQHGQAISRCSNELRLRHSTKSPRCLPLVATLLRIQGISRRCLCAVSYEQ